MYYIMHIESDTNISTEDSIIAPEPVIAKVPTVTSEEQSSVETKSVNVVITQAGSGTSSQLEGIQLIIDTSI